MLYMRLVTRGKYLAKLLRLKKLQVQPFLGSKIRLGLIQK